MEERKEEEKKNLMTDKEVHDSYSIKYLPLLFLSKPTNSLNSRHLKIASGTFTKSQHE